MPAEQTCKQSGLHVERVSPVKPWPQAHITGYFSPTGYFRFQETCFIGVYRQRLNVDIISTLWRRVS